MPTGEDMEQKPSQAFNSMILRSIELVNEQVWTNEIEGTFRTW